MNIEENTENIARTMDCRKEKLFWIDVQSGFVF